MTNEVVFFEQMLPEQFSQIGSKGRGLARLFQAGYPVPDGFVILPAAFHGEDLNPQAWVKVKACLASLRKNKKDIAFAVRSSALAEDSAAASYAGEFETVLNLSGDDEIQAGIHRVRKSRASARVQVYSQAKGMGTHHELGVIVQRMADAALSGVLFTADPVSGSRVKMVGNYVVGLGDELVSGAVDGTLFEIQRPHGQYRGPKQFNKYARKLYRLALRLENDLGGPQDIEWAIEGGKVALLQSRPITTLSSHNPATGEWNDTLTGDYLWSNVNFGEAVTEAMTPLAWSVLQFTLEDWVFLPGFATTGNIGGNPYLNISIFASLFNVLGRSQADLLKFMEGTLYISLPNDMAIPLIPITARMVAAGLANLLRIQKCQRQGIKHLPVYLGTNKDWFQRMRGKIQAVESRSGLADLWANEIAPHVKEGVWTVLGTATHSADYTMALRRKLTGMVGPEDANILIANVNDADELLPSLGPVAGLAKVAAGEMERGKYLEMYGHRGPHEFEISKPRPVEDPGWFDQQLAQLRSVPVNVDDLIAKQLDEFNSTWARFLSRYPRKAKTISRQLAENARRARLREEARSAYIRDRWLIRLFALRVGEQLGIDEEIFFLYLDEVNAVLRNDETVLINIPARKETHERHLEFPTFPSIICGQFDPTQWAEDPRRRSDIFNSLAPIPDRESSPKSAILTGSPGSSGRVEGTVRVLNKTDEGHLLQRGEILVTTQTDISWTVLFPLAAAVITDVGAPLSHAAIVARELGIPAVVGCGDATMRLKTGDRVQVDGSRGMVKIL